MKLIQYEGRDIKLPERDWRQHLKRFDARRASPNLYGYNCIYVSSICGRYNYKCSLCPLGITATGTNRCTYLFNSMIGRELSQYVYFFDPVVVWSPKFDAEARQALKKIRDVLSADKHGQTR